ncbi:MAG: DUF5690 family protein [Chitinophagaceae bacterium]
MNRLTRPLQVSSSPYFIIWCLLASFGTYFCMYAFRKPLSTGVYVEYQLFGIGYKTILIITQVLGYMTSKYIGIKVISELRPAVRIRLIVSLILISEVALLLFGLVPYPYNFFVLFFNGLPLGMVWGVVFSFLEGRRYTEMLSIGLNISIIAASGILKTIYFGVHGWLPAISEFWMPFTMGILFLPLFCLFVWMLSVIPAPTEADKLLRTERVPMTKADKSFVFKNYGWGLMSIVVMYILLATMRDFRDNFSVEIWNEIDTHWQKTVLAQTEIITTVIVLLAIASLSLIRSNIKGFWTSLGIIAFGVLLSGGSSWLFQLKLIKGFTWMLLVGTGLFLAYVPIQVALFERMIGLFKIKANAGFFVYICDALGYSGSVAILFYKEFFAKDISWSNMLIRFSYLLSVFSAILIFIAMVFFWRKQKRITNYELRISNFDTPVVSTRL